MSPARNEGLSHAYADLGLVPQGFDLATALEEALTTQVAAYYDPHSKEFRVVGGGRGKDVDEIIVAHELTHALDDQHFDLETFGGGEDNRLGLSEDERTARQFVTEGEATFMMLAWRSASGEGRGKRLGPLGVAGVRMAVALLGAADPIELLASARGGRSVAELSPEDRGEIEQMTKLPPVISLPLIEPYFKGAALVSEVWGRGGWDAVADLYRHPPASTEQILHLHEKFFDRRDPPILMRLPAGRLVLGGPPIATDVLGELGLRAYFKSWNLPSAEAAAAGWGGDRFWVWKRAGQFTWEPSKGSLRPSAPHPPPPFRSLPPSGTSGPAPSPPHSLATLAPSRSASPTLPRRFAAGDEGAREARGLGRVAGGPEAPVGGAGGLPTRQFLVLWATRWDSEADARRFFAAYLDTLAPRFPGARIERAGPDAWRLLRPQGDLLYVERRSCDVDVVVGARLEEMSDLRSVLLAVERQAAGG